MSDVAAAAEERERIESAAMSAAATDRQRRFQVGDPIPVALSRAELAGIIGLSLHRLDELRKAGTHPAIEQLPGAGVPRFSGAAAKRWLDGREGDTRRFFKSAGRRRQAS